MPEFLLPFGPFHMVLLHLPIGALVAIWFVELFSKSCETKRKNPIVSLLHLFLVLSCAITIVIGLAYVDFGDYGNDLEEHTFWGYIFGGCALATYVFHWIQRIVDLRFLRSVYFILLIASTASMIVTGHYGGESIHGRGFLTKPFQNDTRERTPQLPILPAEPHTETPQTKAPSASSLLPVIEHSATSHPSEASVNTTPLLPPVSATDVKQHSLNSMADDAMEMGMDSMDMMMNPILPQMPEAPTAAPLSTDQVVLFEQAHTIFKNHCFNCHGATKQKGDYRMDNPISAYEGGKSKLTAIVPGAPRNSEIIYRMNLPRSHKDTMPPEKKEPVTAEDLATIEAWILAGAVWPTETDRAAAPREHVEVGDANTTELLKAIETTEAKAEYNAWGDNSVRVDLSVANPNQLKEALSLLDTIADKLTWLDLGNLELPNGTIASLTKFERLTRLNLDGSNVSDQQLEAIGQLPNLTFLNLYNTQISDTGLARLKASPSLQTIVLTDSRTTQSGINDLKRSKPELKVIYQ